MQGVFDAAQVSGEHPVKAKALSGTSTKSWRNIYATRQRQMV
jgi:hypothetical protein